MIDIEISAWLTRVKRSFQSIESVWLIGSRANDTEHTESDWDFLVFADQYVFDNIKQSTQFHHPNIDFLVVTDGDRFENAWGEIRKTGALSLWNWTVVTDESAEYEEIKWVESEEQARFVTKLRKARRV